MARPVHRPHVVLSARGAELELHSTIFTALTAKSETFSRLQRCRQVPLQDLEEAVERLLEDEEEGFEDTPRAWRFVQTSSAYLGPALFAIAGCALAASCGHASVLVTDEGFVMRQAGQPDARFMAIETTKTQTVLVLPDGYGSGSLSSEQLALAQDLGGGNTYVTAVPAGFAIAVQQPLFKLRARLIQAKGGLVLLTP